MQEENTNLIGNVCSDEDRLAIIKGSITAESGHILDPFLSSKTKVKTLFPPLINLTLLNVVVAILYLDFKQGILFIVCS